MHHLQRRHGLFLLAGLLHLIVLVHLLHGQDAPAFQRGDLVRMKSNSPAYALRVIAVPGDRLRMDATGIYVNDAPVTGLSAELIANNRGGTKRIPPDHYFVAGEQRVQSEEGDNLSQTYNFTPGASLVKVR
jgi:signal peptidase I